MEINPCLNCEKVYATTQGLRARNKCREMIAENSKGQTLGQIFLEAWARAQAIEKPVSVVREPKEIKIYEGFVDVNSGTVPMATFYPAAKGEK